MDVSITLFVEPDDLKITSQTKGDPLFGLQTTGPAKVWISPGIGDPTEFTRMLRRLADELDQAHRVWLDENADTWGRNGDGTFVDCGGFGEHTGTCPVGQQIASARRVLARRQVIDESEPVPA